MLLTEADARTKLCPIMRGPVQSRCAASMCMMWRAGDPERTVVDAIELPNTSPKPSGFHAYRARDPERPSKGGEWVKYLDLPRGFCGLAGNPAPTAE